MQILNERACPLCHLSASMRMGKFFTCQNCGGIFRARHTYPTPSSEKDRYENHNNDIHDGRYQKFVSPITQAVLAEYSPTHQGLDFGAGTGPVISYILRRQGYQISQYDPFFHKHLELLHDTYDYVVCCEVMEHFHHPDREFERLRGLLKTGGGLFCMTHLYEPNIDFDTWYYKNDPTHVFIYQQQTVHWIAKHYDFRAVKIDDRLLQFYR